MRCLTPLLQANALARLLGAAIGRNSPLRTSETGTNLLGLRAAYAARFGVEPVISLPWYGTGERGLLRLIRLLERSLEENERRLVLESADFDGFDEPFLDGLGADEFENVKLDAAGRPIPPDIAAETERNE